MDFCKLTGLYKMLNVHISQNCIHLILVYKNRKAAENQTLVSLFLFWISICLCAVELSQLYSLQGGMEVKFLSVQSHLAKRHMLKDLWTDQCQGWAPQFPANSIFLEKRLPLYVVFTCKQSQRDLKCWLEWSWTFRLNPSATLTRRRNICGALNSCFNRTWK